MYLKNDDAKIMMGIETDDIINEPFESSLKKYQEGLETKMKRSHFIFESANLLYYYLHKISIKWVKSHINSPSWIKKTTTINQKNKDNECFKYAVAIVLNHKTLGSHPERISSEMKTYVDQYNWKDIEFPPCPKNWIKLEQNNKKFPLILYMYHTILRK